jgi:hypothetical protein
MAGQVPNPFNESDEAARARRRRSVVLASGLVVFILIVFFVTIAKLGGHVADRPL